MLADRPRDSYVLATKLFGAMSDTDRGLSREQVLKQIDASLARLRTDYVDLYQCHRYDWDTPLEETMQALTEVVRTGKARYLGFSEWPAGEDPGGARAARRREVRVEPAAVLDALARAGARRHPALRGERHLADRVVAARAGRAHGQVHAGAAAARRQPHGRRSRWEPSWGATTTTLLARVQELRPVADGLGITMAQLALAWVLREPNVASAIIGASRPEQVEDNAAASGIELDDATLQRIDEILGDSVVVRGRRLVTRMQTVMERDVAVVLSGGAVNGVLMELGFLKRLRESDLWPRIGWIYGTSSGALSGTMAALDRLDEPRGLHAPPPARGDVPAALALAAAAARLARLPAARDGRGAARRSRRRSRASSPRRRSR